jgi:hypothetical protein
VSGFDGFGRGAPRRGYDPEPPAPEPEAPPSPFFSGLDLGKMADFSALVVVERRSVPNSDKPGRTQYAFDVRHLHRWPLKTPYPDIITDTKALFADGPLARSKLVVDQTGVGRPVVDMFRAAGINATLRPFTITAGEASTTTTVAKKQLVAGIQAPLCSGRLRFSAGLALTPVLANELERFRVKVTPDRNEVFESWRERDSDDLVLALALALHVANVPPYFAAVAYCS